MPKPARGPTEVVASPQNDRRQRRKFTAEEKLLILHEADGCSTRGEIGELLHREGIYSSHLSSWRFQRDRMGMTGLQGQRPGRKPKHDEKDRTIERLQREKAKLEKELRIANGLIDLQKKAHEILGIALPRIEDAIEDDSPSSSDSARRRSR